MGTLLLKVKRYNNAYHLTWTVKGQTLYVVVLTFVSSTRIILSLHSVYRWHTYIFILPYVKNMVIQI